MRRRLRRRQLQRSILLLAPAVLTITCLIMPAPATTHGMLAGGPPMGSVTFRSLSSDEALQIEAERLHITVTEDVPVGHLTLLSVTNTSGRSLHVTTSLSGVDDLTAHSSSVTLMNGGSANVWLTGKALAAGFYTGTLTISAMNGYLQKEVTVEVTVLPKKTKLKKCLPGTEPKIELPEAERPGEPEPTPPVVEVPDGTTTPPPAEIDEPAPIEPAPIEAEPTPADEPDAPVIPVESPTVDESPLPEDQPAADDGSAPVAAPAIPALDPGVEWVDCGSAPAPAVPPAPAIPPGPGQETTVPPAVPDAEQPKADGEPKTEPAPEQPPTDQPEQSTPQPEEVPPTDAADAPESATPADDSEPPLSEPPAETSLPDQTSTTSKGDS